MVMAFNLNFLSKINAPANSNASTYLKLPGEIPCLSALNRASRSIDNPAEAINATTAGRRAERIVCTAPKFLYL